MDVQIKAYLTTLTRKQFFASEQKLFFTQHGVALIVHKSKNLIEYNIEGDTFVNSKGDIFKILAGKVINPPSCLPEEMWCLPIKPEHYLELANKNCVPVRKVLDWVQYQDGLGNSPIFRMKVDMRKRLLEPSKAWPIAQY